MEIMVHTVPYFRVIVIAGTRLGDLAKSPREVYSWKSPNLRIVLCYGLFSLRAKIRTYAFFFMFHFFFDSVFVILLFQQVEAKQLNLSPERQILILATQLITQTWELQ